MACLPHRCQFYRLGRVTVTINLAHIANVPRHLAVSFWVFDDDAATWLFIGLHSELGDRYALSYVDERGGQNRRNVAVFCYDPDWGDGPTETGPAA